MLASQTTYTVLVHAEINACMSPQANGSVQELMARAPLAHKRLRSHNFGDLYPVDSSVGKLMLMIMARLWNEIVYNQTVIFMLGLPDSDE